MPCQNDWDTHSEISDARRTADKATRVACELAEALRGVGSADYNSRSYFIKNLSEEAREWIRKHDQEDERRKREELEHKRRKRLKKQALAKLTSEEREVLGLRK